MTVHHDKNSELSFGPFDDDNYFNIEESKVYKTIASYGVKSVEFVLVRLKDSENKNKLILVEAKKQLREDDCADVSQKFVDSLYLTNAISLGLHKGKTMLPQNIMRFFREGGVIEFILVVKDNGKDSASRLKRMGEAMKRILLKEYRIWKFTVIAVGENHARNYNLVLMESSAN